MVIWTTVPQPNRVVFTEMAYLGLTPPDTAADVVVAVLGGPGTVFDVRDLACTASSELAVKEYPPVD
jgi:hypothetical protein